MSAVLQQSSSLALVQLLTLCADEYASKTVKNGTISKAPHKPTKPKNGTKPYTFSAEERKQIQHDITTIINKFPNGLKDKMNVNNTEKEMIGTELHYQKGKQKVQYTNTSNVNNDYDGKDDESSDSESDLSDLSNNNMNMNMNMMNIHNPNNIDIDIIAEMKEVIPHDLSLSIEKQVTDVYNVAQIDYKDDHSDDISDKKDDTIDSFGDGTKDTDDGGGGGGTGTSTVTTMIADRITRQYQCQTGKIGSSQIDDKIIFFEEKQQKHVTVSGSGVDNDYTPYGYDGDPEMINIDDYDDEDDIDIDEKYEKYDPTRVMFTEIEFWVFSLIFLLILFLTILVISSIVVAILTVSVKFLHGLYLFLYLVSNA